MPLDDMTKYHYGDLNKNYMSWYHDSPHKLGHAPCNGEVVRRKHTYQTICSIDLVVFFRTVGQHLLIILFTDHNPGLHDKRNIGRNSNPQIQNCMKQNPVLKERA